MLPSTQSEGKRIFFPQLNLLLPWTGFTNYIVHLNFCFIFFSLYTNMRVHALNCNILEIFNLWTKNFSYGRRSKHWYVQALLMAKRNEFNSNELVTILNIILPKVQYFFGDIFEKLGISCWDEFRLPEKKIMEIFRSEWRIRFAPIVTWKKHMHVVTHKWIPKKVKKQQCCIYVGWRWKSCC